MTFIRRIALITVATVGLGLVACSGSGLGDNSSPSVAQQDQAQASNQPAAQPAAPAAPTATQIAVATPVAVRGPTDPPNPWVETEQPGFAGDTRRVYNHDNRGLPQVYLTWYFVGLNADPVDPAKITKDLGKCSLRITTAYDGERLSTLGAWRKFGPVGNAYTKDQLYEIVRFWLNVLETEPRGACAQQGAYTVSWQDSALAPSNPQGRP